MASVGNTATYVENRTGQRRKSTAALKAMVACLSTIVAILTQGKLAIL